ncbi:MAG: hypothetical protein J7647_08520 [Cyanobacteria bacterium SBLK]|nr:hypothetical protein [Cyanobacteria bacterium SBLK]
MAIVPEIKQWLQSIIPSTFHGKLLDMKGFFNRAIAPFLNPFATTGRFPEN